MKPNNIIIDINNNPYVIDFGIMRDDKQSSLTDADFQPHSRLFLAPEQYHAKKNLITYRTDFFNIGLISYFLINQGLPFGNDMTEIGLCYDSQSLIIPTSRDDRLYELFISTLAFNPSERIRSAEKLIKLLETL